MKRWIAPLVMTAYVIVAIAMVLTIVGLTAYWLEWSELVLVLVGLGAGLLSIAVVAPTAECVLFWVERKVGY